MAEKPLKCPRCNSDNTKFCYFNNQSMSQPRYFCKTCKRYWTQGGALRDVPIGGGTRSHWSKHLVNASSSSSSSATPPPQQPRRGPVRNQAVSNSLPFTNTFQQGGGAGIMSSDVGVQLLSSSSQSFNQFRQGGVNVVDSNYATGSSSLFTISQTFNQLVSPSLPFNKEMNPKSQPFNPISPPFTPISCFNAVDDSPELEVPQPNQVQSIRSNQMRNNTGGTEFMFPAAGQGLTQPGVAVSSLWTQPQSFVNNDNDLATTSIPLSDMFNYNPNSMDNYDQNITLPNNWPGPPDLGLPK